MSAPGYAGKSIGILKILLPLVICVSISMASAALIVSGSGFASGFDGYYYAIQTDSVLRSGKPLMSDSPLAFYSTALASVFTGDAVEGVAAAKIIIQGAVTCALFVLVRRLTGSSIPALWAAATWAVSFSGLYFSFELLKNNLGNLIVLLFLCTLTREPRRMHLAILCMFFFLAALAAHDFSAALAGIISLFFIVREFSGERPFQRGVRPIHAGVVLLCIALAASFVIIRFEDVMSVLQQLDPVSAMGRYGSILSSFHPPEIRLEIFISSVLFPLLGLAGFIFAPEKNPVVRACALLLFAITIPIFKFDWESAAYRFLLQSLPFALVIIASGFPEESLRMLVRHKMSAIESFSRRLIAPELIWRRTDRADTCRQSGRPDNADIWKSTDARLRGTGLRALSVIPPVALAIAAFLALAFSLPWRMEHIRNNYQPRYSKLAEIIPRIKALVPREKIIIAHKGLSSMIWHETGIKAIHFSPQSEIDRYYRVAYGFGPVHFEPYLEEGLEALSLSARYTLVSEQTWQMFYGARKADISFLKSWLNPSGPIPEHVSRLSENGSE